MSLILVGRRRGGFGSVQPFFADNLAGGTANNANGFTWGALTGRLSVSNAAGGVNGGTHAIAVSFGPDAPDTNGAQASANIVYNLGRDVAELWVEWHWLVPSNYVHRINATLSNNNKFFGIWRDSINNMNGWRVVLETLRVSGGTDESIIKATASTETTNLADQSLVTSQFINSGGPVVKNVWTRNRVHLRGATSASANDGILRWWAGDTLLCNVTNGDYWNQNGTYSNVRLNTGYFMGASNSGFDDTTVFYLADFKFYDQNPGW